MHDNCPTPIFKCIHSHSDTFLAVSHHDQVMMNVMIERFGPPQNQRTGNAGR